MSAESLKEITEELASRIRAWKQTGYKRSPEAEAKDWVEFVSSAIARQEPERPSRQSYFNRLRDVGKTPTSIADADMRDQHGLKGRTATRENSDIPATANGTSKACRGQGSVAARGITLIQKLEAEIGTERPPEKERRSLTFEDGLRHAVDIIRQHFAARDSQKQSSKRANGIDHDSASPVDRNTPLWNNVGRILEGEARYYKAEVGDRLANIYDLTDAIVRQVEVEQEQEVTRIAGIIDRFWQLHAIEPATGFTPEQLAEEIVK
jgi:hypothetical protein